MASGTLVDHQKNGVIGAFDVIEHIEQDERVLLDLWCAIKARGGLIISMLKHRWLWSAADEHACHVRRCTNRNLLTRSHVRVCEWNT
jgi:2-polyprenyl-3-methyl-5-hydroxy-6-metoxy-1,4-benzoquinol methylase